MDETTPALASPEPLEDRQSKALQVKDVSNKSPNSAPKLKQQGEPGKSPVTVVKNKLNQCHKDDEGEPDKSPMTAVKNRVKLNSCNDEQHNIGDDDKKDGKEHLEKHLK